MYPCPLLSVLFLLSSLDLSSFTVCSSTCFTEPFQPDLSNPTSSGNQEFDSMGCTFRIIGKPVPERQSKKERGGIGRNTQAGGGLTTHETQENIMDTNGTAVNVSDKISNPKSNRRHLDLILTSYETVLRTSRHKSDYYGLQIRHSALPPSCCCKPLQLVHSFIRSFVRAGSSLGHHRRNTCATFNRGKRSSLCQVDSPKVGASRKMRCTLHHRNRRVASSHL